MLGSVVLLSLAPIFIKSIQASAISILVFRCILGALCLFLFVTINRASTTVSRRRHVFMNKQQSGTLEGGSPQGLKQGWYLLAIPGMVLAVHWYSYFLALQSTTVTIAVLTMFTFPVFTALLQPLFTSQRGSVADWLLLAWVAFGLYLVLPPERSWSVHWTGALWGVLSAFLFAIRNLVSQRQLTRFSGSQIMLHQLFWAALIFLPFANDFIAILAWPNIGWALALAVFGTALAHSWWMRSHASYSALQVGLVSTIGPVLSILWAAIYFQEWPGIRSLIGSVLVLSGAVLEIIRSSASEKQTGLESGGAD
ncbi:MAG: DMT family transporter [Leptospiraceae bacterium]|nr:DMT family transporter [Leptospiraceae bacterium]